MEQAVRLRRVMRDVFVGRVVVQRDKIHENFRAVVFADVVGLIPFFTMEIAKIRFSREMLARCAIHVFHDIERVRLPRIFVADAQAGMNFAAAFADIIGGFGQVFACAAVAFVRQHRELALDFAIDSRIDITMPDGQRKSDGQFLMLQPLNNGLNIVIKRIICHQIGIQFMNGFHAAVFHNLQDDIGAATMIPEHLNLLTFQQIAFPRKIRVKLALHAVKARPFAFANIFNQIWRGLF